MQEALPDNLTVVLEEENLTIQSPHSADIMKTIPTQQSSIAQSSTRKSERALLNSSPQFFTFRQAELTETEPQKGKDVVIEQKATLNTFLKRLDKEILLGNERRAKYADMLTKHASIEEIKKSMVDKTNILNSNKNLGVMYTNELWSDKYYSRIMGLSGIGRKVDDHKKKVRAPSTYTNAPSEGIKSSTTTRKGLNPELDSPVLMRKRLVMSRQGSLNKLDNPKADSPSKLASIEKLDFPGSLFDSLVLPAFPETILEEKMRQGRSMERPRSGSGSMTVISSQRLMQLHPAKIITSAIKTPFGAMPESLVLTPAKKIGGSMIESPSESPTYKTPSLNSQLTLQNFNSKTSSPCSPLTQRTNKRLKPISLGFTSTRQNFRTCQSTRTSLISRSENISPEPIDIHASASKVSHNGSICTARDLFGNLEPGNITPGLKKPIFVKVYTQTSSIVLLIHT